MRRYRRSIHRKQGNVDHCSQDDVASGRDSSIGRESPTNSPSQYSTTVSISDNLDASDYTERMSMVISPTCTSTIHLAGKVEATGGDKREGSVVEEGKEMCEQGNQQAASSNVNVLEVGEEGRLSSVLFAHYSPIKARPSEPPPRRIDDYVFCTSMPTRVESMHSLEHPRLARRSRNLILYRCPLCCEANAYRASYWRVLMEHYTDMHWSKRRYIGEYTCFPCRQDHGGQSLDILNSQSPSSPTELTTTTGKASEEQGGVGSISTASHPSSAELDLFGDNAEEEGPKSDAKIEVVEEPVVSRAARAKRRARRSVRKSTVTRKRRSILDPLPACLIREHFHCPICEFLSESFDHVLQHAALEHAGSEADPGRTPLRPEDLYLPLINPNAEEVLPLNENEPDVSSSSTSSIDLYVDHSKMSTEEKESHCGGDERIAGMERKEREEEQKMQSSTDEGFVEVVDVDSFDDVCDTIRSGSIEAGGGDDNEERRIRKDDESFEDPLQTVLAGKPSARGQRNSFRTSFGYVRGAPPSMEPIVVEEEDEDERAVEEVETTGERGVGRGGGRLSAASFTEPLPSAGTNDLFYFCSSFEEGTTASGNFRPASAPLGHLEENRPMSNSVFWRHRNSMTVQGAAATGHSTNAPPPLTSPCRSPSSGTSSPQFVTPESPPRALHGEVSGVVPRGILSSPSTKRPSTGEECGEDLDDAVRKKRRRRVTFDRTIRQVTYDRELSFHEKIGSVMCMWA